MLASVRLPGGKWNGGVSWHLCRGCPKGEPRILSTVPKCCWTSKWWRFQGSFEALQKLWRKKLSLIRKCEDLLPQSLLFIIHNKNSPVSVYFRVWWVLTPLKSPHYARTVNLHSPTPAWNALLLHSLLCTTHCWDTSNYSNKNLHLFPLGGKRKTDMDWT